jgi:hypothetical protein
LLHLCKVGVERVSGAQKRGQSKDVVLKSFLHKEDKSEMGKKKNIRKEQDK